MTDDNTDDNTPNYADDNTPYVSGRNIEQLVASLE